MSKKVAFHTLGCRLNIAETGSITQGFVDRGYQIVDFGEEADVVFLNTCTVTDGADSTCRNLIRKARKTSPSGRVVVAGCYAQMEAKSISHMQEVDLILGTSEKYRVFDYLNQTEVGVEGAEKIEIEIEIEKEKENEGEEREQIIHIDKTNEFWGASTSPADEHTRAFLKIQDGCNYVCSFCIIPFARGRSRTLAAKEVVSEAKKLIEQGRKEIVLTGVNIGEYEHQSGDKLATLLFELGQMASQWQSQSQFQSPIRFRLSSVEPNTITHELLSVMKDSSHFMDHFHIPLQSGDDSVLKAMRRKYTVQHYREIILMIKQFFPLAGIGADIIVGFPGEGEEEFNRTLQLLRDLPITHFHVFPYSKRKGTTAATLKNQVSSQIKKERVRILTELGKEKLQAFAKQMLGKTFPILIESGLENYREGYTPNYLRVRIPSMSNGNGKVEDLRNQIIETTLVGLDEKGLIGMRGLQEFHV